MAKQIRKTDKDAGRPLTVKIEKDQLVIRVGIDTMAYAFETMEDNQPWDSAAANFRRIWKVTDKLQFARGMANVLCNESEDGSTPLTRLLDQCGTEAAENAAGVEEDGRIVTRKMLEYYGR
jgi:hypothetical protein